MGLQMWKIETHFIKWNFDTYKKSCYNAID